MVLALLNGGWMIFDGCYVLKNGKYFGPPTPGAWSKIVQRMGINPFSIGPFFIVLGLLWLISSIGAVTSMPWGWLALLATSLATLWYIKVGTAISIITLLLLFIFKSNLGYA
jgi:hypothetical protein